MAKYTTFMADEIRPGDNPYSHLSVTSLDRNPSKSPGQETDRSYEVSSYELSPVSTIDIIRANLSADWTLIYQGCNMTVFLGLSVIPIVLGVPLVTMIAVVATLGVVTALLGVTLDDVGKAVSIMLDYLS